MGKSSEVEELLSYTYHTVFPDTDGMYGYPFTTTLGPPSTIVALSLPLSTKRVPEMRTRRGTGAVVAAVADATRAAQIIALTDLT